MKTKTSKRLSQSSRFLAAFLSLLLGLGPLATPAFAAITPLADQPLGAQVQAKPNIVLTIDDSTSMLYDFLPDITVGTNCRDGTGARNAACGWVGAPYNLGPGGSYLSVEYIYEQYGFPFPAYTSAFPASGPGAGCNLATNPPTCSPGISPGPSPGIATYPSDSGSPLAGQPYGYWLLWPAPAHNSAMNALYYNPMLTYAPPVASDGTPYPSMDSSNTTGWTLVPANPFLHLDGPWNYPTDPLAPLVDLTATVTVGQWCNSDWTQGNDDSGTPFGTNQSYCRSNGNVSASSTDSTPANIGDYTYPWAPASITPNDVTSKVDTSTINYTSLPAVNATVKPAWTNAENGQYFYENDNVLWCDISSAAWPTSSTNPVSQVCDMGLNTINQTCNGYAVAGTCSATATGTCAGVVTGACNTGNGTCAGFVTGTCNTGNGNCNGVAGACNTANGNCNSTNGTCNTANGVCGGVNGACNTANGNCGSFVTGVCGSGQTGVCGAPTSCSATHEACAAGTGAACNGLTAQTCLGTNKTCDAQSQSCNGYKGPQTCTNLVTVPPPPSSCTSAWDPPGCNTNPDPEGTCTYQTTCPAGTQVGTCSVSGATCTPSTAATDCPTIYGTCSIQTSKQCSSAADCTGLKYCNGTTTTCNTSTDCPVNGGHCSITSLSCNVNTDCPAAGTCNYQNNSGVTNGTCGSVSDCKAFPNHCAVTTGTTCTTVGANSASCPTVAGSGTCSNGGTCTTLSDCLSKCTNSTKAGTTCTTNAQCNTNGTCTAGLTGNTCLAAADCNKAGACTTGTNTGTACTANGANATCGPIDKCSAGLPNTTTCTTAAQCNTTATCTTGTNTGTACTGSGANATCGAIDKCTVGNVGTTCTTNAQCNTTGTCTTGTNTGTACTANGVNATCGPIDKCSAGLPNTTTCTTAAQCNATGTCTTGIHTGLSCTGNGANATCGAIDKCSAGQPSTTTCTTAAQCNFNGACSSGANTGVACSANGVNATCGVVNKCSAGKPSTTSCTTAAQCNVTGACTSGNVGATCTTNGTTSQCGLATGICSNTAAACTSNTQCAGSTGHCSTDTTQTCTANGDCLPYGHCSVQTGNRCRAASAATDCPTQPGTLNPVSARCDTTGVSGNVATTLLADANGPGLACRRNNHAYAGVLASRFNYPSGNFTTPITGEITAGQGCSATPRFANVPRHYWKTSVEWCDTAISTAADKWLGYGDITQGTCQADQDSTHIYARFYQFGSQTDAVSNYTTAAFAREDLTSGNTFTHTSTDVSGQTTTVTRTYAQEMENYANWFAYYRDRIHAVKTATALSFLGKNTDGTYNLDESKFRVGLHTLSNNPSSSFVNIQDFDLTQKALWATQLFGIDIQLNQETPSLNAMARIGDYFTNGTSASLSGSTDPIVLSCQKNWHMFFTDGITNQPLLPSQLAGDTDDNVPPLGGTVAGLATGSPWPAPFHENVSTTTSNSLSDYATEYWSADMRLTGPNSANNVPTSSVDPANWQHLNFAALSLGTQGKLAASDQAQVLTQLAAGTLQWTVPYPTVNQPDASGVDDLWHAAVNGRGRFVNAKSVAELQVGMGQILADALNSQGARSSATFTSNNLTTTSDSFVYEATFQPSWGGTLAKYLLSPTDGTTVQPALWHAETQLAQMLTPTTSVPTPWRDSRKVVTMTTSGTPVPFLWANLSAAQQDALAPGNPTRGQLVLAYLRGDQSNEGSTLGQFRQRDYSVAGALGDIVDSSAAYAGPPNMPYLELYDPGYSSFKTTWASRPGRVYVGANDGMLHAFDDATGNETFGYIPRQLFSLPTSAGLGSLTYQFGGLPPFVHHFLVDSTPTVTDVVFGAPSSQNWHSLLVGGLGKGGHAYYAIDVTNPGAITSETLAANTVKWEFTDPDMGYTYGQPLVTKTRAFGGQWVVVVPSGYNNASGLGKLWFLDAATGSVLATMSTGDGTPTDPSGLAEISGYTQYYVNYLADQIYAGDLHGNVWRFDIMDTNPSNWTVSKLAVLTDPSGTRQPVTVPPQVQIDIANATDRWVFVGTGKLLDDSDLSNTQVQTFYALRDGSTRLPNTISTPIVRSNLDVVTDATGLGAAPTVGWLQDLTDVTGQRVVTPIVAVVSIVAYAATSPNTDPCITGQPAEVFARGFSHGDSRITDDSGNAVNSISSPDGAVGINIVSVPNNSSGGDPSVEVPQLKGEITLGSTGGVIPFSLNPPPSVYAHRMSWHLLNE